MEIVNMVAKGIQQATSMKDQFVQKENVINMVQDEENNAQQQLTEMHNLIQAMQQQSVAPSPSVALPPSSYPTTPY
eukprot:12035126-Ditylum_brightwellii.AAC.1